jgi:hypothetical protein
VEVLRVESCRESEKLQVLGFLHAWKRNFLCKMFVRPSKKCAKLQNASNCAADCAFRFRMYVGYTLFCPTTCCTSTRYMTSRRFLSRKAKSVTAHTPSLIQLQLEQATNSPGGLYKICTLIQDASNDDIKVLNEHQWSPLVGAIFRLGKNTTRKGNQSEAERQLIDLICVCHRRKLSLDSGAYFAEHFHRPLTISAYFGFYSGVRRLLEFGALPDLVDGEGKTVWHAAFDNPCASSNNALFRECDRQTANVLLQFGAVTSDFNVWKARNASRIGSVCHVNAESKIGSPLYRALMNKRLNVVRFIVESGGFISDREYLILHRRGDAKRLLLRMVGKCVQALGRESKMIDPMYLNWSFPPTWKAGVNLGIECWELCGLPLNMFQSKVMPFLDHDWFFTNSQLKREELPERHR